MARKTLKISTSRIRALNWTIGATALAAMLALGPAAHADGLSNANGTRWQQPQEKVLRVSERVSEKNTLNLLSVSNKRSKPRVARAQLGNGSYVCSPSGFGQKSRCRRN